MKAAEHDGLPNTRKSKRRTTVSTAELYVVLEALLPFAQTDIEDLADSVENFPDDPDHTENVARLRLGKEAIESAQGLIASKTGYLRRKVRARCQRVGHHNLEAQE
jgi:hypothetical protein